MMTRERWLIGAVVLSLAISGYAVIQSRVARTSLDPELREMLNAVNARLDHFTDIETRIKDLAKRLDMPMDRPQGALAELANTEFSTRTARVRDGGGVADPGVPREHTVQMEEAIAERVEAKIGERMEKLAKRERNAQGEWEAPISELAAELDFNDHQENVATAIFDKARADLFEILHTMRDDGGSLVDDLAADLMSGMAPAKSTRTLKRRIFKDLVPGTDRTYLSYIIALRTEVMATLGEELNTEQMHKLDSLRINPLNVKTGYDPMREYIEERMSE